jgi:hypothetical protein
MNRDSSVGIATGYGLDCRGSIPGRGKKFLSSQLPGRLWGQPSVVASGYRGAISRWVKRPGRDADHSHPSSAEVRNGGAISPHPRTSINPVTNPNPVCSHSIHVTIFLFKMNKVALRNTASNVWTVRNTNIFAFSSTGVVVSNPVRGMEVCLRCPV